MSTRVVRLICKKHAKMCWTEPNTWDASDMRVPGLITHLQYRMEDQRLRNPTRKRWFKRTSGKDASLCLFGQDGYVMLGLDGKLWRFCEYPVTSIAYSFFNPTAGWFSRLKRPRLEICVSSTNPGRWDRKNEYRFECDVCDGTEPGRRCEAKVVHYAWLENLTHCLIRLQRWIRRVVVRRGQIRLALLMGLHPRLGRHCTLGALGHDIILGPLVGLASVA